MLEDLKDITARIIEGNEQDITAVLPNLSIFRQERETVFSGIVYQPLFCVILQGHKEFHMEEGSVSVSAKEAFVISHDMPIASKISPPAPDTTYLAIILSLDLRILRDLSEQVGSGLKEDADAKLLTKGSMNSKWADPLCRYLRLAENSQDIEILAPLVLKEIHYRLLTSPMGGMLRNLLFVDSKASRVARAILHIRERFKETVTIDQLASVASMSSSALHTHFKSVTGTSPMQYQKDLRLIEARNLLMAGESSVSSAALEVGYESPSHFSREYTRKHGCSPKHHLLRAGNFAQRLQRKAG